VVGRGGQRHEGTLECPFVFLREIHKADAEAPIRLNVGDHAAHPEQFVMGELQLKAEPSGRGFAIVRFDEAAA